MHLLSLYPKNLDALLPHCCVTEMALWVFKNNCDLLFFCSLSQPCHIRSFDTLLSDNLIFPTAFSKVFVFRSICHAMKRKIHEERNSFSSIHKKRVTGANRYKMHYSNCWSKYKVSSCQRLQTVNHNTIKQWPRQWNNAKKTLSVSITYKLVRSYFY